MSYFEEFYYNRIIEWLSSGGNLEMKLHAMGRDSSHPDKIHQSVIQLGLEHLQGGVIHNFSRFQILSTISTEELLPKIQSKSILLQFKLISPCPIAGHL